MKPTRIIAFLGLSLGLLLGWHSHGRDAMRWLATRHGYEAAKPPVRHLGVSSTSIPVATVSPTRAVSEPVVAPAERLHRKLAPWQDGCPSLMQIAEMERFQREAALQLEEMNRLALESASSRGLCGLAILERIRKRRMVERSELDDLIRRVNEAIRGAR